MNDKHLYRYDKDNICFTPVSKVKTFFIDNPEVIVTGVMICAVIVACLFMQVRLKHYAIVEEYKAQISALSTQLNQEIDRDTLEMRFIESVFDKKSGGPVSDSIMWEYIQSCRSWYPEYIMAQCIIESSCGKSDLAKNANNLFGMRYIDQSKPHRPTTQIPGVNYHGYGMYRNWEQAVIDRILWERYRFSYNKPTENKYIDGLSNYAEDPDYLAKAKSLANKYKNKK